MRTSIRTTLSSAVLALLLSACADDPVTPPTPPPPPPAPSPTVEQFTVLDPIVWPGGTIRIVSERWRTDGDGAVLEYGGSVLPLSRINDTTLAATAPNVGALNLRPQLKFGAHELTLSHIRTVGYVGATALPTDTRIQWDAYVTTLGDRPYVVGGTFNGRLAVVSMVTGTVETHDGFDYSVLRGPGMTETAGEWIFKSNGGLEEWQVSAPPNPPTKVGDIADFQPASTRQIARFSPNAWLVTTSQAWWIHTRTGGGDFELTASGTGFNEAQGLHLSPGAQRAIARINHAPGGVPVFDTEANDVAYLTDFTSVQGVDFSSNSVHLAVVGGKGNGVPGEGASAGPSVLAILDAATGAVEQSVTLDRNAFAVIFEPTSRWVLVGVSVPDGGDWKPAVQVRWRSDLSLVTELLPNAAAPTCGTIGNCFGGVLAAHHDRVSIYYGWNGPPHIWDYDLLP